MDKNGFIAGDENAHWQERLQRVIADPSLRQDYVESLHKRLKAAYDHMEKVNQDPQARDIDRTEVKVHIDQLEAELWMIEDAEWTREVTVARKEAWNRAVKEKKYRAGGVVFVTAIERDLGFNFATLKRQVARWQLDQQKAKPSS